MDLSVVVIARNEEKTIGKALESVFIALEEAKRAQVIQSAEVIFVDSASTDRTVEIAKGYPVRILQLKKEWPLSAAAGIYTGYKAATGTFFGVVDGDVEVDRYFFRDALPYLQRDKDVGCVYGWWEESSLGQGFLFRGMMSELNKLKIDSEKEVDYGGNGIFRRGALDHIGGHNPYLKGAEDKDVSFRLRKAGFKLLQIPVKIGIHHWGFSFREYYKSLRGWSIGQGHASAYARAYGNTEVYQWFSRPYAKDILFRILRHFFLIFIVLLSIIAAIVWKGIWGWLTLILVSLFIGILFKAKSRTSLIWSEFIFSYFSRIPETLYRFYYFHKGLRLKTPNPELYPLQEQSRRTMRYLRGIVRSGEFCAPIEDVEVQLKNIKDIMVGKTHSDNKGNWNIKTDESSVKILFRKDGYVSKEYDIKHVPDVVRLLEDRLIGYQNKLCFKPGEEIAVYVHSPVEYNARLYRHGLEKECVLDLGVQPAFRQILNDGYFVENGLTWEQSFVYLISITVIPGLYSLLLEAYGQENFAIPFYITTNDKRAKLLVLPSTNTWLSYNSWGGRSRYRNFEIEEVREDFISKIDKIKTGISKIMPSTIKHMIKIIIFRKKGK